MDQGVADPTALADPARLGPWLDAAGLPAAGEPMTVSYVSGGASNVLLELRRGGQRWALRRPPGRVPEGRNETMLREARILAALADTDVPHPRLLAVGADPSVIGAAFYVMDFVDGWSPIASTGWPEPFADRLELRRELGFQLADGIARLARVDWRAHGLTDLGRPDGFHDRQVDRWLAHLARFRFRDIPGLDVAADWLRGYRPRGYLPGIMHGDYQFANVMFRPGAPARLAAIVDWELGTVGDPLLDLAWMVMGWGAGDGYVDYAGLPGRDEVVDYYARVSGRPVDELDYYLVLARFKMAVVLEGGYARVVRGEADNPKMAAFGPVVLSMAAAAAELARTTRLG